MRSVAARAALRRAPVLGGLVALVLGVAFLLAPRMGTDLSAQVARADFVRVAGFVPVDLRWYGGVNQFGYSVIAPALSAVFGPRLLGAVSAVVSAVCLGLLLVRAGATRPRLGVVLGAICLVGNLVSGRTTFALGLAFGFLALVAAASQGLASWRSVGSARGVEGARLAVIAVFAVLASLASPVAGLFVGLAGGAVFVANIRRADRDAHRPDARKAHTPRGHAQHGQAANGHTAHPEATRPDAARPDAARPDATRPEAAHADTGHADAARPDAAHALALHAHARVATVPDARVRPGEQRGRTVDHGVARWLVGWRFGRLGDALALGLGAAVGVLPSVFFSDGGEQLYSSDSMRIAVALALASAVAIPGRFRVVRVGALLAAVLLVLAYYATSPIGYNAARLPMLFAVPVVAAFATLPTGWLVALLAALVWWLPPVVTGDLSHAGDKEHTRAFFQPLITQLTAVAPAGRIEVVPLRDHWESAYVAAAVPLARGWERQVDVARNPIFYNSTLTAQTYHEWLRTNGVTQVAIAPNSEAEKYSMGEAALVKTGLPYLHLIWTDAHWRLYQVDDPSPLVDAPGRLVSVSPEKLVLETTLPGRILVRVWYSRFLVVAGACVAPGPDGFTLVRVEQPGRYTLTSSVRGSTCQ